MDGIAFIRHLHKQGHNIPKIAIMSGSWNGEQEIEAESLGCKIFHKPLEFDAIRKWLETEEIAQVK